MLKALHWLFFIVFLVVLGTAIMNTTFFSKEAIIESFKFSFPMRDIYNIGYADQLFIARIERRIGWVFHFWAGVALFAIAVVRYILILKQKKSWFQHFFYYSMALMFISGLPLYIRAYIDIPQEYQDVSRTIHYYTAWLFGIASFGHIIKKVYEENKYKTSKISNMFHFKNIVLIALFLSIFNTSSIAKEEQNHYDLAMAYYKGSIGGSKIKIEMPNCPYEECKKAQEMKKKMNIQTVEGKNIVTIMKKDLRLALFYFEKSIFEDKNKVAADKALKMLLGEANYKDEKIDDFLLKRLNTVFSINEEEYRQKVKRILEFFIDNPSCFGSYTLGNFIEKGYMGLFEYNNRKIFNAYNDAVNECPNNRMEKILASSKLNKFKDK